MVTKEQWVDWKNHPVTQQYLRDIHGNREDRKDEIADGKVEGNELYLEIGRTQGIKDCFDYALHQFNYIQLEDHNGTESGSVSGNSES